MGEGVSLSLPRNGFLVDNHLVVSFPFSRDLDLNGGFILQDLQAVEGDSFRVYIVGSACQLSSVVHANKVHFWSGGNNLLDQIISSNLALNLPTVFKDASDRPLLGAVKRDPLFSGSGDGYLPDPAADMGKGINGGSHEGEQTSAYGSTILRISTTKLPLA